MIKVLNIEDKIFFETVMIQMLGLYCLGDIPVSSKNK